MGLKNEMSFPNGSMLTFVSNNHMPSWFVIKDSERGINQFEFSEEVWNQNIFVWGNIAFKRLCGAEPPFANIQLNFVLKESEAEKLCFVFSLLPSLNFLVNRS